MGVAAQLFGLWVEWPASASYQRVAWRPSNRAPLLFVLTYTPTDTTSPPHPPTPHPPATRGFLAIANRLIVGPILKTLVFSTTPDATRAWVDDICDSWAFTSIIPAVSRIECSACGAPRCLVCECGGGGRQPSPWAGGSIYRLWPCGMARRGC